MNAEELAKKAASIGDLFDDQIEYLGLELAAELRSQSSEIERLEARVKELEICLEELAEAGAEAWGEHRPCVADAFALLEKSNG